MDWSIIVCVYNASIKDIELTLDSIICQKGSSFEIVVADDHSSIDYADFINSYISSRKFSIGLKYIRNESNLGTVKNILNAVEHSSGQYIKPIGAGDLLYNSDVLHKMYTYMDDKELFVAFGRISAYKNIAHQYELVSFNNPYDISCYKANTQKKIKQNLFIYGDHISGACLFYERKYIIHYLNLIKDRIFFVEDYIPRISILDNVFIGFLDENVVFYQIGTGISTTSSTKGNQRFINDKKAFISIVKEKETDVYIKRYLSLIDIEDKKYPLMCEWIFKIIREPQILFYQLKATMARRCNYKPICRVENLLDIETKGMNKNG